MAQDKAALQKAWDGADAAEHGGKAEVLEIAVGEITGEIEYTGSQEVDLGLGLTTSHNGVYQNETVRLPISASFTKALDTAGVSRGDKFLVKRYEDAIKKKGVGAGKTKMAIYGIKVVHKAPATPAAQ